MPLPPRVQENGLREVPRDSKKRAGPEWHPEETPEQKGCTARTGEQTNAAGTEKEKKKKTNNTCGGGGECGALLDLIFHSGEKRNKRRKRNHRDVVNPGGGKTDPAQFKGRLKHGLFA